MKKRLLCLLLCLVTVFSIVLTSCSSKTEDEGKQDISEKGSESAITLTMWVVAEKELSDATAAAVSKEINAITNSKFKIKLNMNFLTEDEYRAKVEENILAYEEYLANRVVTLPPETEEGETKDETVVTDETETNEFGMTVIKYPEALQNQVDIIYIAGEDMYLDFIEKGWLANLESSLENASKKIKEYVAPTLLSAAKQQGITYAIPNNHAIGEYTYMLLNKELMDKYNQHGYVQTNKIDGFYNENVYSYLNLINLIENKNGQNVIPIDATYDFCLDLLAHYWSIDPDDYSMLDTFSVFGYHYQSLEELNRGSVELAFNSLFEDAEFTADYLKLNQYKFDGYFGDAKAANKDAAITFATGDYTMLADYNSKGYCEYEGEKYYPVPVAYPTASTHDIYGNMFGVCSYSKSLERSMKIITYLNTNSDFRNLLQYGVEGTHYRVDEAEDGTEKIVRLNEDYMMDIYATGNAFISHPEPDMSPDIWESGKIQNRYSVIDPLLGLDFPGYAATTGPEPEKITADSKLGFTITSSSGYSKDVLSQNEKIATWLQDCDNAGKGVYVLETSVLDGQSYVKHYYVYNNNITKNVKFSVDTVREVEVQTNDKGKEVEKLLNLDFILNYENTEGDSELGYELSKVSLYVRKTIDYELMAKVNGANTEIKATALKDLIDFDFFNTQEYEIEVYENMRKPSFVRNEEMMNWINDCDRNKDKDPTTYVLYYENLPENGKIERTYIVYRTGLKYVTNLEILPTGNSGELNLAFNFTHAEDNELDCTEEGGDVNYLIYYLRVTADEDVAVDYTITSNGEEERLFGANLDERSEADGDVDPNFVLLGDLDTELVKYAYQLNQDLVEKLNSCQNLEELTAMVAELKILLSTGDIEPLVGSFTLLADVAQKYAIDGTLLDLYRNVLCITGYEDVLIMEQDPDNPSQEIEATFVDRVGNKESYIYYSSPYAIYRSWLQMYSFMPK